jgi:hypothetical protein
MLKPKGLDLESCFGLASGVPPNFAEFFNYFFLKLQNFKKSIR